MGDYMFRVGDLVTRKSYDNDIIFKIINIIDDNFILKGVSVRLFADSIKDDLKTIMKFVMRTKVLLINVKNAGRRILRWR